VAFEKHSAVRQASVMTQNDDRRGKTLRAVAATRENAGDVDERSLRSFLTVKVDYRQFEEMGPQLPPFKIHDASA
jgi:hypothetical protein